MAEEYDPVVEILPGEAVHGTTKVAFAGGRTVTVRIPPGVADGTRLRLAGQGAPGPDGLPGDVYLRVRIAAPFRPARRGWPTGAKVVTGIAAALVIVLVVALITAHSGGSGANTADGGPATSAPPATTTVPAVSPATYQQALTDLDNALTPSFGQLAGAQSPQAIDAAVLSIQNGLSAPMIALRTMVPPPAAAAAHAALVSGLQGLASDLAAVTSAADQSSVCLGSSATALLSRGADLGPLRDAIGRLAAVSFHVGAFLPPVTQDANRTLATGTVVDGSAGHGEGWLDITNGGTDDATVGLVPTGGNAPVVTVYIGHGGEFTVKGIRDGAYQVFMTSGEDWDAGARLFTRSCQFQKFDDPFTFSTTSSQATTYTITLTPVSGGTANVSGVDPNTYPR